MPMSVTFEVTVPVGRRSHISTPTSATRRWRMMETNMRTRVLPAADCLG